ncbi:MAG: TetR/AcrR family transcriptional regulator [Lachnospiraceae bacterium]|nr:TetR/AcrR family transcriptional regulator [Lachnospiraceae bacterium]
MNPKFFDVKKQKQDAIVNAAIKVFAENGYRKASTDVIVKEAGISKGLLFHYFESKIGVYEFVYDYSIKYVMLELTQTINRKETDFFAIQGMIELTKLRVMKSYPYMQQFLSSVKYETHPDALKVLEASENTIDSAYDDVYRRADISKFRKPVDLKKIVKMIGWMSDGFVKDKFRDGTPDMDQMNSEFASYLVMLRDHFYRSDIQETALVMDEPVAENNISVMDAIKNGVTDFAIPSDPEPVLPFMAAAPQKGFIPGTELSFEERLALGKQSVYGQPLQAKKAAEDKEKKVKAIEQALADSKAAREEAEKVKAAEEPTEEVFREAAVETDTAEETAVNNTVVEETPESVAEDEAAREAARIKAEEEAARARAEEEAARARAEEEAARARAEEEAARAKAEEEARAKAEEEARARAEEEAARARAEEEAARARAEEEEARAKAEEEAARAKAEEEAARARAEEEAARAKAEEEAEKAKAKEKAAKAKAKETIAKAKAKAEAAKAKAKEEAVTISLEMLENGFHAYGAGSDDYVTGLYAASSTVASYLPGSEIDYYNKSRLGDFTYGSDARGGRGIPYDSSENIQIFVEDDEEPEDDDPYADEMDETSADEDDAAASEFTEETKAADDMDYEDLSEKIMNNTSKQTEEQERVKELESMGPAPVLPDLSPENIKPKKTIDEEDEDDAHIYRPLSF